MIPGIKEAINQLETLKDEGEKFEHVEFLEQDIKALDIAIRALGLINSLNE